MNPQPQRHAATVQNNTSDVPALRIFQPSEPPTDSNPSQANSGLELTPELQQELDEASTRLERASAEEILRWSVERFAPRFTMATAFGPEGMVLIHMLAEIAPSTPIFNLDTGYQFAETLELRETIRKRYGIEVELKRPATTVAEYEALHGGPVYQ